YRDRRFWVCVLLVIMVNLTWHFFRVWLPLFLQEGRGYSERATRFFTTAFYVATDAGALSAGYATLYLARRGVPVHRSRVLVYFGCALLAWLSVLAALLPPGIPMLGLLLLVGVGSLG